MKKLIFWLILVISKFGFSQEYTFPELKPLNLGAGTIVIEKEWEPHETFLERNPNFLETKEFNDNVYGNSKNYPATFCKNDSTIKVKGKVFVLFTSSEMVEESEKMDTLFLTAEAIPNFLNISPNVNANIGDKIYSSEGNYHRKGHWKSKMERYQEEDLTFRNAITKIFKEKGVENYYILPLASNDISTLEIGANDVFFEFYFDDWSNEVTKKKFNFCTKYKLVIKDCCGNIIKKYGQSIFGNAKIRKLGLVDLDAQSYCYTCLVRATFFMSSFEAAMESLINQFTADINVQQKLSKRATKIQKQQNFITLIELYKLKSQAKHYQQAQISCLNGIKEINFKIRTLGGSAVDFSELKVPELNSNPLMLPNSSENQKIINTNELASNALLTGAALISIASNEIVENKVNHLNDLALALIQNCKIYASRQLEVIQKYNFLLKEVNQN